ncbi:MAG: hypothetical protein IPK82_11760 [Polyangiaceae bacterium]|nr:hypothetical protein [Polyangiaceae bacterium]
MTAAALAGLAGTSLGCRGIDADVDYPDDLPSLDNQLLTPEGDNSPSITLGGFKFAPATCQGIDVHTQTAPLTADDFSVFLEKQGAKVSPARARPDLYWYDIPNGQENGKVRMRLAILPSAALAAKDLHDSVLDHGPGWWGVRRANLALLMPKASLSEALAFTLKYKLQCWGIFTYAGRDDAYVVPGPYSEP